MNILALDYGMKRIGAALKTGNEIFELPGFTYHSHHELKQKVVEWCETYDVSVIVIGTPSFGSMPQYIERFVRWLESKRYTVVIHGEDLTTQQANKELDDHGIPTLMRKKMLDSISARLILQDYLETSGQ